MSYALTFVKTDRTMNIYSKKTIFLAFIMLSTGFLSAQTTKKYTLQDVIRIAQEQSPDALIAKNRFLKSYWSYRSFKANYLPQVSFNATLPSINRSINPIASQDGTTVYTSQSLTNYSAGLSLNQKIGLTGGTVFLNSDLQRLDNYVGTTTSHQYLGNMVRVGLSQPLFTYNPYKWEKQIEPLKYQQAKRKFMEDNEAIAIKAIDYFFSLLSAQIEQEIAFKNYHNYDTLYQIAKGRFNLGKIAENELLQLQLNFLKADATVEQARLNYNDKLVRFKSFLRLKKETAIELIPPVLTSFFDIPVKKAIGQAKNNTSTGLAFQQRLLEAASELNQARLTGRFNMNVYASFGLSQSGQQLLDAYRQPLDQERVSLGIQIPILDWGRARGNIKMAQSNEALVKTAVAQDKIDFEQNIFLKVMQFSMQKKQLTIAAKSDTVAQRRYDVTQKRYMIGKVNDVLELNNAQIDNDNARLNYLNALKNYWENYFEIRKLTLFDFQNNQPIKLDTKQLIK